MKSTKARPKPARSKSAGSRAKPGPKPGRIQSVLRALGGEIAQGLIPVGAALPPEHELEARFGVGRGVVREAIKTLAAKGLVSVRPRHGTHVRPRSDWSLLDRDVLGWLAGREPNRTLLLAIQEVRSIIEPAAAALAAERATAADRARITAAMTAMERARSKAEAIAADKAFHLAILDATHNPVLQGFRGAIDTILGTVFLVAVGSSGWFDDNLPNHAVAARAIVAGDAAAARAAMEQVLGYTQRRLSKGKDARSRRATAAPAAVATATAAARPATNGGLGRKRQATRAS
jgi:GntR family galactonate operon transcriptional repressor